MGYNSLKFCELVSFLQVKCTFFLPFRHKICENGHQVMNRKIWDLVDLFACNFLDVSVLAKQFKTLVPIQLGYLLVTLELVLCNIHFFHDV